jgi:hypothetical protein
MKMQCPNVVAAAIKLEEHKKAAEGRDLWLLGDALIKDCGGDAAYGNTHMRTKANNGSKATIDRARDELKVHGIEYAAATLVQIRQIAMTFSKADRIDAVSFWGHYNAGNPEILKWILNQPTLRKYKNRKGYEMVDALRIRELARTYRQLQDKERERQHNAAADRERAATTLEDKRNAREEIERLKGMPKFGAGSIKPEPSVLRSAADTMEIDADIGRALMLLQEALPKLREIENLDADYTASFIEECDNCIAAATRIKNFLTGESNVRDIKGGKSA